MRKRHITSLNDRKTLELNTFTIFGCNLLLNQRCENLDKESGKKKGSVAFWWDTHISQRDNCVYQQEKQGLVPQRQKVSDYDNPDPAPELQNVSPLADTTVPSQTEVGSSFRPLYDESFIDEPSTPTNVHAEENNDNQAEFTNPFCTPVQENAESSSRNIGNSNVHTFNQPQDSEYRWTKDHPLTQVRGNPSKPVQTRRQLATEPKMCMFALTVSIVEPKNIKEVMADSGWIEAMQKNFITKGYAQEEGLLILKNQLALVAPPGGCQILVEYACPQVLFHYQMDVKTQISNGRIEGGAFSEAELAGCRMILAKSLQEEHSFLGESASQLDVKEAVQYCNVI
ncbi:hypothetical protein Tco_0873263, partial [Tanacetum coccineum]